MSNISTIMILIVMLIIIMIIFFIYYRKEKDFKKATALLALIILTTTLGILADELVRRTNREPDNQNISAENETITTNNDVDVSESDNIDNKNDNKSKTIKDFLYFISPMARRFFINRPIKDPTERFLTFSSIVSSIVIFIGVIIVSKSESLKKVLSNIIKGLIMSFLNSAFPTN